MSECEKKHTECLSNHVDIIEHLRRELLKCRAELETRESDLAETQALNSARIQEIKSDLGKRESLLRTELVRLKEENSSLGCS